MQKRWGFYFLIFLIGGGIFLNASWARIWIDGVSGEVWDIFLTTDTEYAEEFSDENFTKVRVGMSENQVLALLGEPLLRYKPYWHTGYTDKVNYISLQYSRSPGDTHYRIRQIFLDEKKRVVKIIGEFYVD